MKTLQTTLDLYNGHADYSVAPGIGPVIVWHGKDVDLRKCSPLTAEAMAKDKATRYVQFTPAAMEKQAKAAIAATTPAATAPAAPGKK